MTSTPDLTGWVPTRVVRGEAGPEVEWAYLGDRRFAAPFFEQTVGACFRRPFNLAFRRTTPIEALDDRREVAPGIAPSGFIFHMSRCGSTLIGQMLAALRETVVISEADPISAVLAAPGVDDERRIGLLRGMVAALGQPRRGDETRLILKFDSWNTHQLPLIARAFPGVPWVFVCREPVEVLVSQVRQRAAHTIPGMIGYIPFDPGEIEEATLRPEVYCAKILGGICRAAVGPLRSGEGLALNYRELPGAVRGRLLDLFGLDPSGPDLERMEAVTRNHAKSPNLPFEDDRAEKEREATESIRRMADLWIRPAYDEIEAIRLSRLHEAPSGRV